MKGLGHAKVRLSEFACYFIIEGGRGVMFYDTHGGSWVMCREPSIAGDCVRYTVETPEYFCEAKQSGMEEATFQVWGKEQAAMYLHCVPKTPIEPLKPKVLLLC